MNPQTIVALRVLAMVVGGFAVGHGWVSQESFDTVTEPATFAALCGGLAAIVAAGYAIRSKTKFRILKDASKTLGDDGVIVAPPKLADKLPKNVVGSVEEAGTVVRASRHRASRVPPTPTN